MRQAGSEKYSSSTDRYKRKIWFVNPHRPSDLVYVPFVTAAPTAFADDIDEYAQTHGLHSSLDGTCAMQKVNELVPHVITRDAHRQPSFESIGTFEICLQGDAARRGVKMFTQWILKNPYLDSQSCRVLHLLGLGVGVKDDKKGTVKMWDDQATDIEAIQGKTWEVTVPASPLDPGSIEHTRKVTTKLTATVDFHAEKELWGVIGGGCHCQGSVLHHRVPPDHREKIQTIADVMSWVGLCKEPTLAEHYNLAHMPGPGETLPSKCKACGKFSGSEAEVAKEYAAECTEYARLEKAAGLSDKGRDTFNNRCLTHAHDHLNVRWNARGTPLAGIEKSHVFLELLHSLALNAAKIQIKHAAMKYYPDEIRDEAHRLFQSWGIPIDMRPPGKRTDPEKWPGGGTVVFLIEGGNGKCPGFSYVGTKLTYLMAEHELKKKKAREADARTAAAAAKKTQDEGAQPREKTAAAAAAIGANLFAKPGTSKAKGASALPLTGKPPAKPPAAKQPAAKQPAAKQPAAAAPAAASKPLEVETIPLQCQARLVSAAQVAAIKARYGPHLGQRVISMLLSYETFKVAWKTGKVRLPVPALREQQDAHAVAWFHDWADWVEAIERVSNHGFKSWVPHRILHKVSAPPPFPPLVAHRGTPLGPHL